jgi:Sulfatase
MYLSWMTSTTHYPFKIPPMWKDKHFKDYWQEKQFKVLDGFNGAYYNSKNINTWVNCLRWTDDIVRDVILDFRERGLENETLFVM